MATSERPLRRDAQQNRERILAAARPLFAECGLAATLDDVARRAGLGVGTVYRRFPSRDALVEALFEERILEMVRLVDEALALEDPWEALVTCLERLIAMQASDRGLKEAVLGTGAGRERVARVREQMYPRVMELLSRAQRAGVVRGDLDPGDLPMLQLMVTMIAEVSGPERPDLWRRYLAIVLDGIRGPRVARQQLHPAAVGFDRLDEVMCHYRPARAVPRA
jgi:AcrR family transcriptional regulator